MKGLRPCGGGTAPTHTPIHANEICCNDAEITSTALPFQGTDKLAGLQIQVLHPLLCLEGKLRCLRGLPQRGRHDLKHVKMSILCVNQFLRDFCQTHESRAGLKLVERLLDGAFREDGLHAWFRHDISLESAVPIDLLQKLTDSKWQRFCETRYPQVIEQIRAKREHYRQIMKRIAAMGSS